MSTGFFVKSSGIQSIKTLKFLMDLTDTVKDMGQSSNVLKSLRILGLEEILKLSQVLQAKQIPLKKVAGDDFGVWDGPTPEISQKPQKEAKVLEFPKERSFKVQELAKDEEENSSIAHHDETIRPSEAEAPQPFLSSEILLFQREITKEREQLHAQREAMSGYKRSTEVYAVKTKDLDGNTKIKFASTNGVLVNKKQA